jgi:hypothetical protein
MKQLDVPEAEHLWRTAASPVATVLVPIGITSSRVWDSPKLALDPSARSRASLRSANTSCIDKSHVNVFFALSAARMSSVVMERGQLLLEVCGIGGLCYLMR